MDGTYSFVWKRKLNASKLPVLLWICKHGGKSFLGLEFSCDVTNAMALTNSSLGKLQPIESRHPAPQIRICLQDPFSLFRPRLKSPSHAQKVPEFELLGSPVA
jgi:hypothetical protein